ncbi:MAG TPA: RsmB/NOP family class I SAM-dependent RNA methyltransferase [Thermodesulfobacteriaceae bacterium]|nr:RsmB/NOP family class I SAM-dependent RNA methyltransferase [Thermodesulfobacteriaceae bacterium]
MEDAPSPLASYLDFIPDPEEYLGSLTDFLPPYIRINPIKAPVSRILGLLQEEGVRLADTGISWFYQAASSRVLGSLRAYHLGYIYPQALSSALPVLALDPEPGELVLDMCAAPGGKATHISQLMDDTGTVVANDRKYRRITALTANIKRLGITNTVVTLNSRTILPAGQPFDRVLVDAPCSGEGRYRIGPHREIIHRKRGRTDLPAIQKGLLVKAFDLVKPGGMLVYSTCTINPLENEAVVHHLLQQRSARLLPWTPPLEWSPGLTEFMGKEYDTSCRLCRRFYPHRIRSVGFFLARIVKV